MALIVSKSELKARLSPAGRVAAQMFDHLDESCCRFVARAPFVCLATSDARGEKHLAPLGGRSGFVEILDDRTLLLPEWPAPEVTQQLTDLLEDSNVGLLFLVPGEDVALEVSGTACLSDDSRFLELFREDDGPPDVVILVEVMAAAFVGAGALEKSGLWQQRPARR